MRVRTGATPPWQGKEGAMRVRTGLAMIKVEMTGAST
jgi:hypothetical protein